jgi:hypothetical protein
MKQINGSKGKNRRKNKEYYNKIKLHLIKKFTITAVNEFG